ncbi:S1 RNA-binding domain-containing protein [Candidatus Gracilibacteria bacterium]|nr:S1 RNA-binding domain-containing protein [Candidatus Gracilibacteria bacterium]MBP7057073.1 S1 RNA-binding domain-containing protein [Candidatus Gracilibacteria bacterium]
MSDTKKNYPVFVSDIISMDELLKGGDAQVKIFTKGDVVEGTVVTLSKHALVIDLGTVSGVISGSEMIDSAGTMKTVKLGDVVKVVVIGDENTEGELQLSLRRASQENTWNRFVKDYQDGKMIEVTVMEANKGGLLMEIDGIRGFIPVSQLTPEHYPRVSGADPEKILGKLQSLVGQKLNVKVININPQERRLILSEKAAYAAQRNVVIQKLKVGQTIEGTVSGIVHFGVFVNFEGVEGLVHISEIAWGHVADPTQHAKVGDKVKVMVIGVEDEKISFSLKRLSDDPWLKAAERYPIGSKVKGSVTRVSSFGIFLKLDDEIEGLIHISEISPDGRIEDPDSLAKEGQMMEAKVISVEQDDRRLGLSIKALQQAEDAATDKSSEEKEEKKPKKKSSKAAE